MLDTAAVTTILPVRDLDRARAFYADRLGLSPEGAKPDGKFVFRFGAGGSLALLPKPDARPSETTALSFAVDDIESAVGALEDRGVHFEDYDLPGLRTVNHVCVLGSEKAAWFKDPDGNILCLHEDLPPA
jgi:catechol 2,3-dioxygenase-like lactoylglutathione lyase family enzyme